MGLEYAKRIPENTVVCSSKPASTAPNRYVAPIQPLDKGYILYSPLVEIEALQAESAARCQVKTNGVAPNVEG